MKNSISYQIREIIFDNNLNFISIAQKDTEELRFTKDDITVHYNAQTNKNSLEFSNYRSENNFTLCDNQIEDITFASGLTLFIKFDNGTIYATITELP